jgi:hypothetical protein
MFPDFPTDSFALLALVILNPKYSKDIESGYQSIISPAFWEGSQG